MNDEHDSSTSSGIDDQAPDFSFDELPEPIRGNTAAMGWKMPMPVQAKAIPHLMAGHDMIVQSHTGSGKTGAFLIPLVQLINPRLAAPQALILVPTRELAGQVFREFEALTAGMNLHGALIYGGVGYGPQLDALRQGAQVVIGTPGRILDHLSRRSFQLRDLRVAIFDEADEMLSMGFYPAMREVRSYLPRERVSWMFSATIPYKVQLLAEEFLTHPQFLSLSSGHESVTTMEHRYYQVPPMDKDLMLMRLIELENPESAIIFCNTKSEVEYLATALRNRGYNADQISGDLSQKDRELAMIRIRNRETRFLVATDVAARGIDISDLAYVFQYDVPKDTESYLHRAGRTARAGNTGVVITLVANISEKTDLKKIARKYSIDFVEMPAPSQEEVEARVAERLINLLEQRFRAKMSRAQRDRLKRFEGLVKSLAETDDEWMLMAMLFDEIYQTEFHAMPESVAGPQGRVEEPPTPAPSRPRPTERDDRKRDDRGRDDRGRDDRRRSEREQPEREQLEQEESGGKPRPEEVEAIAEEPRKKKKKRRRKRNRNRDRAEGQVGAADVPSDTTMIDAPEELPDDSVEFDMIEFDETEADAVEFDMIEFDVVEFNEEEAEPVAPPAPEPEPALVASRSRSKKKGGRSSADVVDAGEKIVAPEPPAAPSESNAPKSRRGGKRAEEPAPVATEPAVPAAVPEPRRKRSAGSKPASEPSSAEPIEGPPAAKPRSRAKKSSSAEQSSVEAASVAVEPIADAGDTNGSAKGARGRGGRTKAK